MGSRDADLLSKYKRWKVKECRYVLRRRRWSTFIDELLSLMALLAEVMLVFMFTRGRAVLRYAMRLGAWARFTFNFDVFLRFTDPARYWTIRYRADLLLEATKFYEKEVLKGASSANKDSKDVDENTGDEDRDWQRRLSFYSQTNRHKFLVWLGLKKEKAVFENESDIHGHLQYLDNALALCFDDYLAGTEAATGSTPNDLQPMQLNRAISTDEWGAKFSGQQAALALALEEFELTPRRDGSDIGKKDKFEKDKESPLEGRNSSGSLVSLDLGTPDGASSKMSTPPRGDDEGGDLNELRQRGMCDLHEFISED